MVLHRAPGVHRCNLGQNQHDPPDGRCAKGQRLVAKVPHGHRKTLTFVAGLRRDGITAPCVFDGPINTESFLAWVVQFLVPSLRPGDIVVMDNLSSHKDPADTAGDPRCRGQAVLPAPIQPGPEPDRAGVRQAEDPAAQGTRPQPRAGRDRDRRVSQTAHAGGVPQLLQRGGICVNLKLSCSIGCVSCRHRARGEADPALLREALRQTR